MMYNDSTLLESNGNGSVIAEFLDLLKKNEFPEDEVARFAGKAAQILDNCSKEFGAGTRFRYAISKYFDRVRLRIVLQGRRFNPLADEEETVDTLLEYVTHLFLRDKSTFVSYRRLQGRNIITLYAAVKPRKALSFKSPLLWAIMLGAICGLICQHLPDNIRSFLVDGLADPIGSVVLAAIAGVTGPVIFLSLITSITSLGSISRLTDLGFKIM